MEIKEKDVLELIKATKLSFLDFSSPGKFIHVKHKIKDGKYLVVNYNYATCKLLIYIESYTQEKKQVIFASGGTKQFNAAELAQKCINSH